MADEFVGQQIAESDIDAEMFIDALIYWLDTDAKAAKYSKAQKDFILQKAVNRIQMGGSLQNDPNWKDVLPIVSNAEFQFTVAKLRQEETLATEDNLIRDSVRFTGKTPDEIYNIYKQVNPNETLTLQDVMANPSYYNEAIKAITGARANQSQQRGFDQWQPPVQKRNTGVDMTQLFTSQPDSGQNTTGNINAEAKKWTETMLGALGDSPTTYWQRQPLKASLDKMKADEFETTGQRFENNIKQAQADVKRAETFRDVVMKRLGNQMDTLAWPNLLDPNKPKTQEEALAIGALMAPQQAAARLLSLQQGGANVQWQPDLVNRFEYDPAGGIESPKFLSMNNGEIQGQFTGQQPNQTFAPTSFYQDKNTPAPDQEWVAPTPARRNPEAEFFGTNWAKGTVAPPSFSQWRGLTPTQQAIWSAHPEGQKSIMAMENALPTPGRSLRWKPSRQR